MMNSKRQLILMSIDAAAVLAATACAFLLHGDFHLGAADRVRLLWAAPLGAAAYLAASYYFAVQRGLRFAAGLGDGADILKAALAAFILQAAAALAIDHGFPPAILVSSTILTAFAVALLHGLARTVSHFRYVHLGAGQRRSAVIVGVGDLAELVYEELRSDPSTEYRIVAFVEEGPRRVGIRLHGARIVAPKDLPALLGREAVDEIVVAVERHQRGTVLDWLADTLQTLERRPALLMAPTAEEMLQPKRPQPRKIKPADLLNRRVISLDTGRIHGSIEGKVVLISGAGGTIGGELARQVARHSPKKLILLENNATALFYTESELRDRMPEAALSAMLGDVRDLDLVGRIFRDERPQVVFHAAAHKHVHQLETNVAEGISNNLVGTYALASAADHAGAETFILISTDKAVRPKCVMGATKRAAELVVSSFARKSKTRFSSVRFGNVLGSSGSVLRIFQEQIEKGQPLTLTHPDATRYFMTVEEAVGLVLQASCLARGGEVFVLKMGDQVRIMDMARKLIWLSGLEPGRDVPIRVVGLRPGEKLAEEIIEDPSGQEPSEHPDIMVLRSENRVIEQLSDRILGLGLLTSTAEKEAMIRALAQLVPTFSAASLSGAGSLPADGRVSDVSSN